MRILVWCLILATTIGCVKEQRELQRSGDGYISVLDFIGDSFDEGTEQSVLKVARENGILTDSGIIENYQFQNDLEVLYKIDISNPSQFGKYTVDSLSEDGILCIQHQALNEEQNVQKLKVYISENQIVEVEALREYNSLIALIHQSIKVTENSYTIKSTLKEKPGKAKVIVEKSILKQ